MGLARGAIVLPGILGSPWRTGSLKTAVFSIAYGLILLILERRQLLKMFSFLINRVLTEEN
jgi:hypothetical protein